MARSRGDIAEDAVAAVRAGDVETLTALLADHPELAVGLVPGHGGRSLLHVAADWPGKVPRFAATLAVLVAHGADVNAPFVGQHQETALHWAASNDDVEGVDALLDAGALIDATGGVIGWGTPLNDATAFGQWHAARRLVERGAKVSSFDAAALGLTDRLARMLAESQEDPTPLLWGACHGGHVDTAEVLLGLGADLNWVGWDDLTPLDAAERSAMTETAAWLISRGALRRNDSR